MTVLPGKRGPSVRYPGHVYRADLERDLAALSRAGIVRLILLVEDEELARWSDTELVERAAGFGLEVDRHPMPDGAPPGKHGRDGRDPRAPWSRAATAPTWPLPAWAASAAPGRWPHARWSPPAGRRTRQLHASGSCGTRWPSRPRPRSASSKRTGASGVRDRLQSRRERAVGLQALLRGQQRDRRRLPALRPAARIRGDPGRPDRLGGRRVARRPPPPARAGAAGSATGGSRPSPSRSWLAT